MQEIFRQRLLILGLLAVLFLGVYGVARHYSPVIVAYVVEQALVQKAPEEMSPILVQKRFEAWLASAPPEAKLVRLIVLSSYLEKVQKLTSGELERLLAAGENVPKTGS